MNKNKIAAIFIILIIGFYLYSSKSQEIIFAEPEQESFQDENIAEKAELSDIENKPLIIVHIAGDVESPGIYELEEGARLDELLTMAEVHQMELVDKYFNRAGLLYDGQKIYIPLKDELESLQKEKLILDENIIGITEKISSGKININQAKKNELMELPGIGEKKAEEIIKFREKNGNFKKIDDIINVTGIGNATFEKIRESITI